MGARGPRPKPTALLKLSGSWRGRVERGEPQPRKVIPDCPEWLTGEGRKVWDRMIETLNFMGVLTQADGNSLARYCVTWVRWRQAEEFLARFGTTYPVKDEKGKVRCFMPFPEVAIANQQSQTLTKLEAEFGLTPSSRTRISIDVGNPIRPMDPMDRERAEFFASPRPWKSRKPRAPRSKESPLSPAPSQETPPPGDVNGAA